MKKGMDISMTGNIDETKHKSNKIFGNKAFIIIAILIVIGITLLIWRYNIRLEEKYYDSLQELAQNYYPNEKVVYWDAGNYCYILADRENNSSERFIYKTPEGKYVYLQELFWESFKRKRLFMFKDIEEQKFNSFIKIEVHEGNCIILVGRYFIDNEKSNIKVYDNFGQLEQTLASGTEYYITILDIDSINEDYEVRVEFGDESYHIIGAKEIKWAH